VRVGLIVTHLTNQETQIQRWLADARSGIVMAIGPSGVLPRLHASLARREAGPCHPSLPSSGPSVAMGGHHRAIDWTSAREHDGETCITSRCEARVVWENRSMLQMCRHICKQSGTQWHTPSILLYLLSGGEGWMAGGEGRKRMDGRPEGALGFL
jgi:hypothetical protein